MTKPTPTEIREEFEKTIHDALTKGEAATDVEGNLVRLTPSASLLAVVRGYLKDVTPESPAKPEAPQPMLPPTMSTLLEKTIKGLPFAGGSQTTQ